MQLTDHTTLQPPMSRDFDIIVTLPLANAGPLLDGDVLRLVCLFVCHLWNLLSHSLGDST